MPSHPQRSETLHRRRASTLAPAHARLYPYATLRPGERRKTLDAGALTLQEHTIELSRQQNNTLPLFTLPAELVREVFLYLHHDAEPIVDSSSSGSQTAATESYTLRPRWTPLAETCYALRAIALSFPQLWCTIDCSRAEWARTVLPRAGEQPLTLLASLSDLSSSAAALSDPDAATLVLLNRHAHRARRLLLSGPSSAFLAHVPALSAPTPTLEALSVQGSTLHRPFLLSPGLLGSCAPRLTSLRISQCTFTVAMEEEELGVVGALEGVTSLELDGARFSDADGVRPLSAHAFVTALELLTPRLRELTIRNLQLRPSQHPDETIPARLPALQSLHVHDGMQTVVDLLDRLPRPSKRLDVVANARLLPEARALVPRLMQHLHAFSAPSGTAGTGTPSANKLIILAHDSPSCISVSFRAEFAASSVQVHAFDIAARAGSELPVAAPYLSVCRTLELDFGGHAAAAAIPNALWAQPELPELRAVVVRAAQRALLAGGELQEWLGVRRDVGRARVEEVRFVRCDGFVSPAFEEGLVGAVRWEEK